METMKIEDVVAKYDEALEDYNDFVNSKMKMFLSIFNNNELVDLTGRLLELEAILGNYQGQVTKQQSNGVPMAFSCTCTKCGGFDSSWNIGINDGLCKWCFNSGESAEGEE